MYGEGEAADLTCRASRRNTERDCVSPSHTNKRNGGTLMSLTKSDRLRVPGANLYYQVRGSGPLLLILQGGDGACGDAWSLAHQEEAGQVDR